MTIELFVAGVTFGISIFKTIIQQRQEFKNKEESYNVGVCDRNFSRIRILHSNRIVDF